MNSNISVISSRNPKERIPLLVNILYEYGIKQNKSIYFQAFDINTTFYVNHLISLISKIDFKLVESYMFPVITKSEKLRNQKIDTQKLFTAIETIRNSNINISSNKVLDKENWLDYVFDYSLPYSVIIIDNFKTFIDKVDIDINIIKKHINKYCQKFNAEVILFMNDSDKDKYSFPRWKNSQVSDAFIFEFDKSNYNILDIRERMDK